MAHIAPNIDVYAATRVNIWFPAHNNTPADGNLTGQCVTLEKWVLAELTDVPSPFSARGHGKDVGRTLVNQGHAIEVPYSERRRGDIVCLEYGTYGHVYLILSGGRVFESNVNLGGVATKIVDGERVYASRIGSENEAWRAGKNPHVYRIKTYVEKGEDDMPIPDADNYYGRYRKAMQHIRGRDLTREEFRKNFVGNSDLRMLEAMLDDKEADAQLDYANWGRPAKNEHWQDQIAELKKERDTMNYPKINAATSGLGLASDASPAQITKAIEDLKADSGNEQALKLIIKEKEDTNKQLVENFGKLAKENDELKKQVAAGSDDTELLNGFGKWLQKLIVRLGVK